MLNYLFIIMGVICVFYSVLSFNIKGSLSLYFMAFGVSLIAVGLILKLCLNALEKKKYQLLLSTIKILFVMFLSLFIITESLIIYSANIKNDVKTDYLIVLGAGLWGDVPSPIVEERLSAALEYLNKYPNTKVILSGGMGPGETITEAEAMERYLTKKGIKKNLILKEEKSTNTMENFKFSKALIEKSDSRKNIKVEIITNGFHMFRSKFLAKRNGFIPYGYPAKTYPMLIPTYYTRESIALFKSIFFDR